MALFDVHMFALVQIKVSNVEAADKHAAIARTDEIDLYPIFQWQSKGLDNSGLDVEYTEFAEEVTSYLVDPKDDDGEIAYEDSAWIESDVQAMEMRRRGVKGY